MFKGSFERIGEENDRRRQNIVVFFLSKDDIAYHAETDLIWRQNKSEPYFQLYSTLMGSILFSLVSTKGFRGWRFKGMLWFESIQKIDMMAGLGLEHCVPH